MSSGRHYCCILLFSLVSIACTTSQDQISCISEKGNPVDWFVVYKVPIISQSKNELVKRGLAYFYADDQSTDWKLSELSIGSEESAVGKTLKQLYPNNSTTKVKGHIMYNDEWPNGKKTYSHGHTKGDLCFDNSTGFWLIHSVPKFPNFTSTAYGWPDNALENGQTFICVTFYTSQLDTIGKQLLFTYPWIYESDFIPASFLDEFPNLKLVVSKKHVEATPWKSQLQLESRQGLKFYSFAKFVKDQADAFDIYMDWLAPYFADSLLVESWQDGAGKLPSNCSSQFQVFNVKQVSLAADEAVFLETKDHAKWCVSSKQTWVCLGDLNRTEAQRARHGAMLCIQHNLIHTLFKGIVTEKEDCT